MGFSVTIANVILFVGLLAAGSTLASAMLNAADRVGESARDEWRLRERAAHTTISVGGSAYDAGTGVLTINVRNTGNTVLNVSRTTVLVDGTWKTVASTSVEGNATTRVWAPAQTAVFTIASAGPPTPSRVTVSTENGITSIGTVT